MKKIFALLVIGSSLMACNNNGETTGSIEDSVKNAIDSTADARVDSVKQAADSIEQKVDATFDKTDSANRAIADTATRK
jgi:hypothetical protein